MRSAWLLVAFIVVILTAPTLASSQQLVGGLSGIPLLSGANLLSDAPGGPVAVSVGWVEHRQGFKNRWDSPYYDEIYSYEQPLRGLWLGGAYSGRVWDNFGFSVGGGALIPTDRDGSLEYYDSGVLFHYNFSTDTQWTILDAAATYDFFGLGEAIIGFRWDHFTTRWTITDLPPDYLVVNWNINWYLPYLGIRSTYEAGSSRFAFQAIGMPFAPGDANIDYLQPAFNDAARITPTFGDGYFVECSVECQCNPLEDLRIGGFARYNAIRSTSVDEYLSTGNPPPGDEIILSFTKQTFTLGVNFSLTFDSAGLL